MRIVFFGTSAFAIPSLERIVSMGHQVLLAVTRPDRAKGRYLNLKPPAIKEVACGLGVPVFQPADVSSEEAVARLKGLDADLFVVVAFGQILSEEILAIPKKLSVNLHASLLPKYRGAAPINWAIINGEKTTGVTVFRLDKKMDAGDIILSEITDIGDDEGAASLSERLAAMGAEVLAQSLELIETNKAVFKKQDARLAGFAPKLKKQDGLLDWRSDAAHLHNRVRGLSPWPSAFTSLRNRSIRILETETLNCPHEDARPGEIVRAAGGEGIVVKAKEGCLAIKRLQPEGARPMEAAEFLRGHRIRPGDFFG
jgi:methionyl-tRNA formyltransferase